MKINITAKDIIQLAFDVFCIPIFYVLLVNDIALSNLSMFADPDTCPDHIKTINAVAALYLCNPLYRFLSTAPNGLFRFFDYIKIIAFQKINRNTPWMIEHHFFKEAEKDQSRALRIGALCLVFVALTMSLVFLAIGASGAKKTVENLSNSTLADEAALGLGLGSATTNQVLYTYALTEKFFNFFQSNKTTGINQSQPSDPEPRQCHHTIFKKISTLPSALWQKATIENACAIPSILYSSPYAKAGFETIKLVSPLSFLQYFQGPSIVPTFLRTVFIMGIEIILLNTFKSPYTKLLETTKHLSHESRVKFYLYKAACLLLTLLPFFYPYTIFPLALASSTLIEKNLLEHLTSSPDSSSPLTSLLNTASPTNPEGESSSDQEPPQEGYIKIEFRPYGIIMALLLIASTLGVTSPIELTLGSDTSKSGLNLFKQIAALTQSEHLKYVALFAISATGMGANMLGVEGFFALLFGYLDKEQSGSLSTENPRQEEAKNKDDIEAPLGSKGPEK